MKNEQRIKLLMDEIMIEHIEQNVSALLATKYAELQETTLEQIEALLIVDDEKEGE
jgi:hypothetical protein